MANDTDIFGAATGKATKDADIFGDLTDAPPRAEVQAAAPEKPPTTFSDRMKSMGLAGVKGLLTGGPMGVVRESGMEAMKQQGELMDHLAYGAGEKVSDAAAKVLPAEAAAGLGVAANMGTQAIPMLFGGQAAKAVANPAFQAMGRNLMQSAIKPTGKDLLLGKADRAAQTLLDEGINVTRGGMQELRGKASAINDVVESIIGSSSATVDKGSVASRIQDVVNRIEKSNPTPQDALAEVEKVYNQFMSNGLLPKDIPLARAQELKQGIYRMLKEKYGALSSDVEEAQKALARGFKETIEKAEPAVGQLNAKAQQLWNALNVSERRALMQANNQVGGLSWLTHNPWTWAASMADRSSLIKSLMARALHSGEIPENAARAGIGILNSQNAQPPSGVLMENR